MNTVAVELTEEAWITMLAGDTPLEASPSLAGCVSDWVWLSKDPSPSPWRGSRKEYHLARFNEQVCQLSACFNTGTASMFGADLPMHRQSLLSVMHLLGHRHKSAVCVRYSHSLHVRNVSHVALSSCKCITFQAPFPRWLVLKRSVSRVQRHTDARFRR